MSADAARPFLPALRAVERDLSLPIPERVRIIQELEYDLQAFRDQLVKRGLDPVEAERRALQALVPAAASLGDLGRLHQPLYQRATAGLDEDRLRFVERSALAFLTSAVLGLQCVAVLRTDVVGNPSPFLWVILVLGALLSAVVARSIFAVWVKRDHQDPGPSARAILRLAAAIMAMGTIGVGADFYRLAAQLETGPAQPGGLVLTWVAQDAALLAVSILLALAGGLAWFVLTQWWTLVSSARFDALGLNPLKEK